MIRGYTISLTDPAGMINGPSHSLLIKATSRQRVRFLSYAQNRMQHAPITLHPEQTTDLATQHEPVSTNAHFV